MEKQGMGREYRFCGARLLVLIPLVSLFFLSPPGLFGQTGEGTSGELAVLVESAPERPLLGGTWRISILVDHPVPEEVTVIPPDLPSTLTFAQSRKETRTIRSGAAARSSDTSVPGGILRSSPGEGKLWTLVEFLFVPQRTGTISLGAFEVIVPGYRTRTMNLRTYVTVQEGIREEYHPRLVWDALPSVLGIGEDAELILRILDWDPEKALRPGPFRTTAPAEALLEEIPLTKEDLDQYRVLRLRISPLEGSRVSLGPFPLLFDTLILEAPAISIRLNPAVSGNAAPMAPVAVPAPEVILPRKPVSPTFPETREEPFPLFRKAYGETLDKAREFWSSALYAEAMGELRRGERDLLGGPNLVSTRRAAEQALGIAMTEDEKWRPRNFFLVLIILSFCLLIFIVWLPLRSRSGRGRGKKAVTSLFFRGYRVVILISLGILGFGITGLARGASLQADLPSGGVEDGQKTRYAKGAVAVLRACEAYRVPDTQGAISARWMEGQPVKVRAVAALWAYAESSDGDAGWVYQDKLVFY